MSFFHTVHDLRAQADMLRRRSFGVIVIEDGCLRAVHLRPWPKIIAAPDLWGAGQRFGQRTTENYCWLYYNQPCRHPRFLALKYIVSSRGATFRTVRSSLVILDEIARLKSTDAIVADVRNPRISDRLLRRWGWESHVPKSRRRHFIKRFYGTYPDPRVAWSLVR
jgi:hypothetical protein